MPRGNLKYIFDEINSLRKSKNTLILAHNYQLGEIQDIADFCGDSLELSIKASETTADILIFCGVKFMAETAYILSPKKKVLLPVKDASCLMADMIQVKHLKELRKKYPGSIVVTYINSSAAVKGESDICVTSSNALKIVSALPKDKHIIFVPDANLGTYISKKTGRKLILFPGYCPAHERIDKNLLFRKKKENPDAIVLAHPECQPEVIDLADEVMSTSEMCDFARKSKNKSFIIATECGILHKLQKENPSKIFIEASEQAICPEMKFIRIEDVHLALKFEKFRITVNERIRSKAELCIRKMIDLCK